MRIIKTFKTFMGYDYYETKYLNIYLKNKQYKTIVLSHKGHYYPSFKNETSDSDNDDNFEIFEETFCRRKEKEYGEKILYDNDTWLMESSSTILFYSNLLSKNNIYVDDVDSIVKTIKVNPRI